MTDEPVDPTPDVPRQPDDVPDAPGPVTPVEPEHIVVVGGQATEHTTTADGAPAVVVHGKTATDSNRLP